MGHTMTDPILEEMQRVKDPSQIKASRYYDWVTYLCALVARKDDEIQQLREQMDAIDGRPEQVSADMVAVPVKRGPGRPRKVVASV